MPARMRCFRLRSPQPALDPLLRRAAGHLPLLQPQPFQLSIDVLQGRAPVLRLNTLFVAGEVLAEQPETPSRFAAREHSASFRGRQLATVGPGALDLHDKLRAVCQCHFPCGRLR